MRPTRWPEPSARHRLPAWRAAETPTSPRKEGLCWAWHTGVGGLLCPSRMQTSSTAASTQLAAQQPACRHTQHEQGGVGSRGTGRRESSASLDPASRRLWLAAAHPGAPLVPPATAPTAAAAPRCILAGGAYPARQWSGPPAPCLACACWFALRSNRAASVRGSSPAAAGSALGGLELQVPCLADACWVGLPCWAGADCLYSCLYSYVSCVLEGGAASAAAASIAADKVKEACEFTQLIRLSVSGDCGATEQRRAGKNRRGQRGAKKKGRGYAGRGLSAAGKSYGETGAGGRAQVQRSAAPL
jgi:hypothetical protein